MNRLTCSIVLFNEKIEVLKKAVDSFINATEDSILYLIDNSPKDLVSAHFSHPRIVYIFNNKNLGFGAGHNIAIREAISHGSVYHLVMNPDVYFDATVITDLSNLLDLKSEIGLVLPNVLYPNGKRQAVCRLLPSPQVLVLNRIFPLKFVVPRELWFDDDETAVMGKIFDIPFLSGCFMFLRVDALNDIGFFDEDIFLYMEDIDLCRRIHKKYRTVFFPDKTIYHVHQRGSVKRIDLFIHHIVSVVKYFNKWGWISDNERRSINRNALLNLQNERRLSSN